MTKDLIRAGVTVLLAALSAGCVTEAAFVPSGKHASEYLVRHAAGVLLDGVDYTRWSGQEVAGWCWRDQATGRLGRVEQAHLGSDEGVGLELPLDPARSRNLACSWHTHPWGSHVAPGPSRRDLANSNLPWVRDIPHFLLDQYGLWHYARGRIVTMCPWMSDGSGFAMDRCRA
jgi:hypothetical protein